MQELLLRLLSDKDLEVNILASPYQIQVCSLSRLLLFFLFNDKNGLLYFILIVIHRVLKDTGTHNTHRAGHDQVVF